MTVVRRKYRISRRCGVSLWGQAKDPVHSKNYPPGESGVHGFKKKSDFGKQFAMHKKFKYYYHLSSKQMKRAFHSAYSRPGDTGDNFIGIMESRLCTVVYRSGLAPTIFAARQLIVHKHIIVNGRVVNIPSYSVGKDDEVKIIGKMCSSQMILNNVSSPDLQIPDYLSTDAKTLSTVFVRVPKYVDVPYPSPMTVKLLIEFYSR